MKFDKSESYFDTSPKICFCKESRKIVYLLIQFVYDKIHVRLILKIVFLCVFPLPTSPHPSHAPFPEAPPSTPPLLLSLPRHFSLLIALLFTTHPSPLSSDLPFTFYSLFSSTFYSLFFSHSPFPHSLLPCPLICPAP